MVVMSSRQEPGDQTTNTPINGARLRSGMMSHKVDPGEIDAGRKRGVQVREDRVDDIGEDLFQLCVQSSRRQVRRDGLVDRRSGEHECLLVVVSVRRGFRWTCVVGFGSAGGFNDGWGGFMVELESLLVARAGYFALLTA